MSKILTVYYSWSNGNTKKIAEMLNSAVGGDIARIETVDEYKGSYNDVVDQGQEEVNRGYCPPIKELDVNVSDYDVIAIGTPTWWYTTAPAVLTFLRSVDWNGKTVIPFMTNGGWPGHVIEDIRKLCGSQNAKILDPMEIQFDSTGGSELITPESKISEWINSVKADLKI